MKIERAGLTALFKSFAFWFVFGSAAGLAISEMPAAASLDISARFSVADSHFSQREDDEKARLALQEYREAYQETPAEVEAAWRVAMGCYFVGLRLTPGEEEQKRIFQEGIDAGRDAVRLQPDCVPCRFWLAINMALYGERAGVFKMLFSLDEIRSHLKRSAELDPGFASAGAFRLLGLIEQKLPGILGGSDDRARAFFEKAIELSPGEPLNYLFLAKLLEEDRNRRETAIKTVERALQVSPPDVSRLESREALIQLRELAERLKPKPKAKNE